MVTMGDNGQGLPALTPSDIDTTINHEPRIRDLRLAEALGMANPHAIRRLIERHRDVLGTFGEVSHLDAKPNRRGGRRSKSFYLTKRQALYITAKSDTERAALVTIQMVELFDQVTTGDSPLDPAILQRLSAMPPDQRERLYALVITDGPAAPPDPPFCTGCAAKDLWRLGGMNQTRHPLRRQPLDLTDLELIRITRERIAAEVKRQLTARIDAALAATARLLTDPPEDGPS